MSDVSCDLKDHEDQTLHRKCILGTGSSLCKVLCKQGTPKKASILAEGDGGADRGDSEECRQPRP